MKIRLSAFCCAPIKTMPSSNSACRKTSNKSLPANTVSICPREEILLAEMHKEIAEFEQRETLS